MRKWLKISLVSLTGLLIIAAIGFLVYVSDYYRADDMAIAVMTGTNVKKQDNIITLTPGVPTDTGLIFYPGAKVEHTAYLPLLEQLTKQGITCVLAEMPFNLAIFDADAADKAIKALPDIKNWYIGGHSLGGAMASGYASKNSDSVAGLILLGAYIYGDFPTEKTLTLYGSEDNILNKAKLTYTQNVLEIKGGNHAGFGNYGAQRGDGIAKISSQEQQEQTVSAILEFIKARA